MPFHATAGDDVREKIIGDLHEYFTVSIAGMDPFAAIPSDEDQLDEIAAYLKGVEGIDPKSVTIE